MTIGMNCPECGNDELSVKDSRPAAYGIRRRRLCTSCGHRFTTYETAFDLRMLDRMLRQMEAVQGAVSVLHETARDLVSSQGKRVRDGAEIEFEIADLIPKSERAESIQHLRQAVELLDILEKESAA